MTHMDHFNQPGNVKMASIYFYLHVLEQ